MASIAASIARIKHSGLGALKPGVVEGVCTNLRHLKTTMNMDELHCKTEQACARNWRSSAWPITWCAW